MKKINLILILAFLITLSLVSAGTLKVTSEHPFLINGEWIPAKELKIGDRLTEINGKTVEITSIKKVTPKEPFLVYNIEAGKYHNFVVRDTDNLSIVVHNSNAPPFTDPLHPVCGNDCIWGNNKVSVKYPDGTIKIMSFKKFYQKYQINSDLKLIGIRSNEVILEDILRKDYSGDIISFKVGEVETKLTADHLVELFNGEFIPARSIRDGLIINTGIGPQLVQNTRVYTVHDTVTVFEPVTTKSYILEEKGPSLKNSAQEIGGVEGGVTSQQTPSQPNEA